MMKEEIIEKIRSNRISTTEIADALGKRGVMPMVKAVNPAYHRVGEVFLAFANDESNWNAHKILRYAPQGTVAVVKTDGVNGRGVFGELVTKFLVLYRRVEAVVVDGNMRDGARLVKEKHPVWAHGFNPVGCKNIEVPYVADDVLNEWKLEFEGSIAVCDDGGVVIIRLEDQTQEFLEKLDFVENQEDIWFFCLDTKKWDTYDIVCKKKYKGDETLPQEFR